MRNKDYFHLCLWMVEINANLKLYRIKDLKKKQNAQLQLDKYQHIKKDVNLLSL